MNLDMQESSLYLHKLSQAVKVHRDVEVVLAPSIFTLQSLSMQINWRQFKLAAQNFYWRDEGAFTGEVSATQLKGIVQYALVGHSERRHVFGETNRDIRHKVAAAVRNNIKPVLCIGETAWEHANGETDDVIMDQLLGGLTNITSDELSQVLIAYEPVWSIGNGNNASASDVESVVRTIRGQIAHLYGAKASKEVSVLYGGSVTEHSAADYLNLVGVDGLLVGSASLNAHTFNGIIEKAHQPSGKTKK